MRSLPTAGVAGAVLAALVLVAWPARPMLAVETTVVVQQGDTLTSIAAANGTSVEQLVTVNALPDPNRIVVGQLLRVVTAQPAPQPGSSGVAPVGVAVAPMERLHVVTAGEHLTAIASRYATSVPALVELNAISNPRLIMPGQTLRVPSVAAAVPPGTVLTGYAVNPGDTLIGIAAAHGTTVDTIAQANAIANPSHILAGTTLQVPVAAPVSVPPAAAAPQPAAPQPAPTGAPAADPAVPAAPAVLAAPAPAPASAGGVAPLPMPDWIARLAGERDGVRQLIAAEADRFAVPRGFALAVAWHESGWQQSVVSSAGAVGVMQLLPATGDWVSQSMLGEPVNIHDTASNVRAGVRLLRHYLDRYGGDRQLALAAYFQGQSGLDQYGIYEVSRPYIDSILVHERIFSG